MYRSRDNEIFKIKTLYSGTITGTIYYNGSKIEFKLHSTGFQHEVFLEIDELSLLRLQEGIDRVVNIFKKKNDLEMKLAQITLLLEEYTRSIKQNNTNIIKETHNTYRNLKNELNKYLINLFTHVTAKSLYME